MPPKFNKIYMRRIDVPVTELQKRYIYECAVSENISEAEFIRQILPTAEEMARYINQFNKSKK